LAELEPVVLAVLPVEAYTTEAFPFQLMSTDLPRMSPVGADGADHGGTIEPDEVWLLPADPEALP
jgi:hypothetical protein